MRMMLKFKIPTEPGNRAIKEGSLPKLFESITSQLKPEATYFVAEDGCRCALIFFDMKQFGNSTYRRASICWPQC
jgi:hypothetical protein